MGEVGLRPADDADSEFCYLVNRAALGEYVDAIWGWDETYQRAYHAERFVAATTRIITFAGVDIGTLNVDRGDQETFLGRIVLDPAYQGRGIGRQVIEGLQAEGRPITLEVFVVNTRARALYRRLGFQEVDRPSEHKIAMRWESRQG